jgi:hypothetical protein
MLTHCFATFRLGGDRLDPGRVSSELGLQPSEAFRRGDPFGRRDATRHTGGWMLDTRLLVPAVDLAAHVVWLLDRLEPVAAQLARIRREPGIYADIFCFLESDGQGEVWLDPAPMRRCAMLDLPLGIDLYQVDPADDQAASFPS